jgi:hypothetical protein
MKPPAQRALTMVQHHKRWLEARKARIKQDVDEPNGTYDNRAMVRFSAASQPNAGAMLDISPDGSFLNTFSDMDLEVYVQRRGGLDISCATGVFDALERSGSEVDRKGDGLASARRLIEYGCCKGVQGPSSGVEVSLCVRRSGVLGCRYGNFACE